MGEALHRRYQELVAEAKGRPKRRPGIRKAANAHGDDRYECHSCGHVEATVGAIERHLDAAHNGSGRYEWQIPGCDDL